MAILNDDEDQTKNMNRSISGGTSYIGGGYSGGAGQDQSPRQAQGSGPGSGFVNISEYLSGPSGSARMAGGIADETEKAGQGVISQVKDYSKNAATETAVPDFDTNTASDWLLGASTFTNDGSKPVTFTGKAPDTTYKGPSDYTRVSGYEGAQKATSDVKKRVENTGTFEGVQGLLTPQVPKGTNYTPGMSRLDAGLTRGGAGAPILGQSQNNWSGIGSYLSGAEKDVGSQISAAKDKATNVTAQWQNAEQMARDKAGETNKIFGDLATQKIESNKIAKKKQEDAQKESEKQGKINEQWGKSYLDKQQANSDVNKERASWIGPLKPGGIKDGWMWSQQDIDNYLTTGNKPNRRQDYYGVYSTPEGNY